MPRGLLHLRTESSRSLVWEPAFQGLRLEGEAAAWRPWSCLFSVGPPVLMSFPSQQLHTGHAVTVRHHPALGLGGHLCSPTRWPGSQNSWRNSGPRRQLPGGLAHSALQCVTIWPWNMSSPPNFKRPEYSWRIVLSLWGQIWFSAGID